MKTIQYEESVHSRLAILLADMYTGYLIEGQLVTEENGQFLFSILERALEELTESELERLAGRTIT